MHHFLGIEVTRKDARMHLCQAKYIKDILTKVELQDVKPWKTPTNTGDLFENPTWYRKMIGSLQYVTITRLDLAQPTSKLSEFMENPMKLHQQACKKILRILKRTQTNGLFFTTERDEKELLAYSDAGWGCGPDDIKLMRGLCIYLGGNLISWHSKKQYVVAMSSTQSEYRSSFTTYGKIVWLISQSSSKSQI